ncbi:glycoside hydrolase family 88 protein [Olivibacter domesticus]|uniref:Glycosyl Hydrolase Family 88 n=1 Tax=Olivibacter domesticus TaxID=407022 RepID=A0A1H7R3J9_OLID1|nr:glycoside hydrolase family 88 protein [Olivibacter domesticus]SEL54753.1 Glycosyl Hydrolase Family 88 [Olivibacter domesticus]
MKLIHAILFLLLIVGCQQEQPASDPDDGLHFAVKQTQHMLDTLGVLQKDRLPKSVDKSGRMTQSDIYDWTSGFFPGSLWYLYEFSKNDTLKQQAIHWTELLKPIQFFSGHHDVGFMINCSYGNAFRITGDTAYRSVMVQTAKSLMKRYNPKVGAILSWDADKGWQKEKGWKYPVIIDNMMNLELLFKASQYTGDSTFYKAAVSHADKTMQHHFRPDYSSYHVVDYDPESGAALHHQTAQGDADSSAWARGQAWGLYAYTFCYRETGLKRYLEQAEHIANFILQHPRLPADKVPYWDFDAPGIPDTYRDASAAAIIASALIDLAKETKGDASATYRQTAETIVKNLSNSPYRAALGTNQGFILKHSVGSLPHQNEIDVPLAYADYYYIEALMKLRK